jgi:hypothetical protein
MASGFQGFAGFDFTRSEELQAEFQQGLQGALTSGNPDQMGAAVMQQVANTLTGGSPEVRAAKKKEKVLKGAFQLATEKADSEGVTDELEKEILYFQEAQKAAADAGLPDIAMQATSNLSQLRLMQEERARLKAQDSRLTEQEEDRQQAHDIEVANARLDNLHTTTGVIVDPEDDNKVLATIDLLDENAQAEIQSWAESGGRLITMAQHIELTEAERDRQVRLKNLRDDGTPNIAGRSGLYNKYHTGLQATNNFAIGADSFVDILLNPDAAATFAAGGSGTAGLQKLGQHSKSVLNAVSQAMTAESGVVTDLTFDVEEKFKADERFNALSSQRQALVMELGYALATSREGGRLTDQDVDRAIVTLGVNNPDPRAVAYVFGNALKDRRDAVEQGLSKSGVKDIVQSQEATAEVVQALDEVIQRLETTYELDFDDVDENGLPTKFTAPSATTDSVDNVEEIERDNQGNVVVKVPSLPGTA